MSSIISLGDAGRRLTERRLWGLVRSLALAHKDWSERGEPAVLSQGTRGSFIHDYFYWHAGIEFSGLNGRGFRLGEHGQQRYVAFDDEIIVRVKHFDKRLAARNARTGHSELWEAQLSLDGMPTVARLNLGYRLDLTATHFKDIFITLPNGDPIRINDWVWQLYGEKLDTFGTQLRLGSTALDDGYRYSDFSSAAAV